MKFNTISAAHDQIKTQYPNALTLAEYVVKHKKLDIGTTIINHPAIPPIQISKQMLENDFPSLQECFWWYVI